ncbi:orotate phosphoribosyltransferase [bacterium]
MNIDVKKKFIESNALLKGHFMLSSGLHSDTYMQSALVLKNPKTAEQLGNMLSEKIKEITTDIDLVVAPAMGGLIIGHEVARSLGKDFVFTERVDGKMILRRGFQIQSGAKVVIIEDVFTTGKSTKEVIALLETFGAVVQCCASLVDRSNGLDFDVPYVSLLKLDINNYNPDECSLCKDGIDVQKPGTRFIKK